MPPSSSSHTGVGRPRSGFPQVGVGLPGPAGGRPCRVQTSGHGGGSSCRALGPLLSSGVTQSRSLGEGPRVHRIRSPTGSGLLSVCVIPSPSL